MPDVEYEPDSGVVYGISVFMTVIMCILSFVFGVFLFPLIVAMVVITFVETIIYKFFSSRAATLAFARIFLILLLAVA